MTGHAHEHPKPLGLTRGLLRIDFFCEVTGLAPAAVAALLEDGRAEGVTDVTGADW